MSEMVRVYRNQMVRAVLGPGSVILAKEADTTALDRMAARLMEAEEALTLLRAKGYGAPGLTLVEVVKALPSAPIGPAQLQDVWSSR